MRPPGCWTPRAPKVEMPPELAQRISRMKADAEKIKEAE